MNKISFLDELMSLGGVRSVVKTADDMVSQPPVGMMSGEAAPPADIQHPAEVATRLPTSTRSAGVVQGGELGDVTSAKDPIDRHKFNRAYRKSSS
jgi:hypothetical protein